MEDNSDILKIIGNNIKQARLSSGLTQEVLAERLNKSTNFVSLVERGASGISISTLVDICNVLHIDTSVIFKGLVNANNIPEAERLINSLSMFEAEDREIVSDLIKYIMRKRLN